jgi:DnaJ-class molecular chaperone
VSTEPADSHDPQICTPCRGTGTVISGLGGTPTPVTCPWCDGSGQFQRDHDAQAAKRES